MRHIALVATLAVLSACRTDVPGLSCEADSDCRAGAACRNGICIDLTCVPACRDTEVCVEAACKPPFSEIRLLAPADGGPVAPAIHATAELVPTAGASPAAPQFVVLTASHELGDVQEIALARVGDTWTYEGDLLLSHDGNYAIVARLDNPQLASRTANLLVQGCDAACAVGRQECLKNLCTPLVRSITLKSPADGSQSKPAVSIKATIERTAETLAPNPPQLLAEIAAAGGETATARLMPTQTPGEYAGTWSAPRDGVYTVVAALASEPDAIRSAAAQITVDSVLPSLKVSFTYPTRDTAGQAGLTVHDPVLKGTYFRRDEGVDLLVTSDEALNESTVKLKITDPDGLVTELLLASWPAPSQPIPCPAEAKLCKSTRLDLGDRRYKMKSFRGKFLVSAEGADRAGNKTVAPAEALDVTRWKWLLDPADGETSASPAVATNGQVWYATTRGVSVGGKLHSVTPDGKAISVDLPLGFVAESVMLWPDPTEAMVVSGAFQVAGGSLGGRAYVVKAGNIADLATVECRGQDGTPARLGADLALAIMKGSPPMLVGVARAPASPDTALLLTAPLTNPQACRTWDSQVVTKSSINVAVKGTDLLVPDSFGQLREFTLTSADNGTWKAEETWPLNASGGFVANPIYAKSGPAGGLVQPSIDPPSGFLFSVGSADVPAKQAVAGLPWNVVNTSTGKLVAGAGNQLFVATEALLEAPVATALQGTQKSAPVLGLNKAVFAVAAEGVVQASDALGGVERWNEFLTGMGAGDNRVSPVLDCTRDATRAGLRGRPGVLYAPLGQGKLLAVVVDSPGIDASAGWPRYRHDPFNSSNYDADLSKFSCP